jgi:hypothetical protein
VFHLALPVATADLTNISVTFYILIGHFMAKKHSGEGSVVTDVRGKVVSGVCSQCDLILILILIGTYACVRNIVCLGLGLLYSESMS